MIILSLKADGRREQAFADLTSATVLPLLFSSVPFGFGVTRVLKGKWLQSIKTEDDMDRSEYPIQGVVWGQDLRSECHATGKRWLHFMVSDKPGCAGFQERSSLRDRPWQIYVVFSSLGSFACCNMKSNENAVIWVISGFNQSFLVPPPASRSPAEVRWAWCAEMRINKCLSCCPPIRCAGPLSETAPADKEPNQLVAAVLGREVGGRAEFN